MRNDQSNVRRDADSGAGDAHFFRSALDEQSIAVAARPRTTSQEVSYLNGLTPAGSITNVSFWGDSGQTAYKWGEATAGTGATITYSFQGKSRFTATEQATFEKAFAMWSSIANVTFVETTDQGGANVLLQRGRDGGAYNSTASTQGSGTTLGSVVGQALISIDTSVPGFDLSGSFAKVGGYGISTVIHEIGHLLGLGHGGNYNGDVEPATDQFSAYDDQMYTIMSYISWEDTDARFAADNPVKGTNWGNSADGYSRTAAHSAMTLDIAAMQQLYGKAVATPFDGGETYGFHSNISGDVAAFFDFRVNAAPVVTLYNQGIGNTLDLSGYAMDQVIDLTPGAFSSVGGLTHNVAIAPGTVIETALGGSGKDVIHASDVASTLFGRAGNDELHGGGARDMLSGGAGADIFYLDGPRDSGRSPSSADLITDFSSASGDRIDLSAIDAIKGTLPNDAFAFIGTDPFHAFAGELRFEVRGNYALVLGDVNGDGRADFAIRLAHVDALVAADFVL